MRPTIFLIDDDEDILEFYQSVFQAEEEKFEVKAFDRVEKAMAAMEQGTLPDTFLVDIMMPGMDGIEFTEIMHERRMNRPVIVVSGYAEKEHAIRALNAGAFALLEKPVSAALILNATQRAVAFHYALSSAEALLKRQEELIKNLECLKNNYEDRLIELENQMIEIKGHLGNNKMGGMQALTMLKEYRMINAMISSAKKELESIKEQFDLGSMWR